MLALLESEIERAFIPSLPTTSFDEEDDEDDFSEWILILMESEHLLKDYLSRINVF